MTQINLFPYEQKQTHKENKLTATREKGRGGINQEFGISRYKLLHIKQIDTTVLPCNIGNYSQYLVINHHGKEYVYKCITEPLCSTPETNTTL